MRTFAVLSLFTLASAVAFTLTPSRAHAQVALAEPYQQMAEPYQVPAPAPSQMPEPYQPPDPYETAADPSQIDWPQDVAAEEPAVDSYDDGYDPQAYTEFQNELAPYGSWVDDASYGRVWVPEGTLVGADFTPYYTGGHWALTEFGWTWVSDYSWGWAPFHYGRWIVVSGYGWCWVPGTAWGPAWVAWRAGDGFVGWAPLPPRGVSVAVTYGRQSGWRFSRAADLAAPRPRCLPARDVSGMFHRTMMVTNDRLLTRGNASVHINAGPRHIPGAVPAQLRTIAPQAFPQRAILPRRGATMSARPWIRAANGGAPTGGGIPAGRVGGVGAPPSGAGRVFGGHPSWHSSAAPAQTFSGSPPPRVYNPQRPVAPGMFTNTAPRISNNPSPTSSAPHVFNAAPASVAPRVSAPQPTYGAPHTLGASPASPHFYNAQPRVASPAPPVTPQRTFSPGPVQHAPAPAFHGSAAPPVMHAPAPPPSRSFSAPSFSAPAPSGGGSFGHAGGAHFGGGHRR